MTDQFMLGEEVLVAPILQKGEKTRTVRLPAGTWVGRDGAGGEGRVRGPDTITVDAEGDPEEHDKLIWFIKKVSGA